MSDLRVPDLNKVIIAGRLTRDPELKYTSAGKPWCRASIANTRYYKGSDGERKEETTFVELTVWGPMAEFAGQRLKKGRPVLVEGSLRTSEWEDKASGQKRSRLELNAQRITPLDWEEREGGSGGGGGGGSYSRASSPPPREIEEPLPEDDIPF
ncbi:MAG: single-stranded DNA-binding protein [Candidatus Hydrogenedentes bacterium]|nr:single-stranded DNA-binding protein [Candidatus Hydrogenedentota bacterium]